MRNDHWVTATRALVVLPALSVHPSDRCTFCNQALDHKAAFVGSTRGSVAASYTRASIHPSVCKRGQFKNIRHDVACEVLCKMWSVLGGQGVCDHWKAERGTSRYGALSSACTLAIELM